MILSRHTYTDKHIHHKEMCTPTLTHNQEARLLLKVSQSLSLCSFGFSCPPLWWQWRDFLHLGSNYQPNCRRVFNKIIWLFLLCSNLSCCPDEEAAESHRRLPLWNVWTVDSLVRRPWGSWHGDTFSDKLLFHTPQPGTGILRAVLEAEVSKSP